MEVSLFYQQATEGVKEFNFTNTCKVRNCFFCNVVREKAWYNGIIISPVSLNGTGLSHDSEGS